MYRSSEFFGTFIKLNWHFLKCEWCKTHNNDTRTSAMQSHGVVGRVAYSFAPSGISFFIIRLQINIEHHNIYLLLYFSHSLSSGSHIENWHSVLRNGLVNASYTKLQVCKLHQSADLRLVSWLDSSCSQLDQTASSATVLLPLLKNRWCAININIWNINLLHCFSLKE